MRKFLKNAVIWVVAISFFLSVFIPHQILAEDPETGGEQGSQIDETTQKILNSLSFFTGKVTRTYSENQAGIQSDDLRQYIDLQNKRITSKNEQLDWDFDKGILKINTARTQGVAGFVNKTGQIEFDDIIIQSSNDYATIVVTSLDDNAIGASRKILIQAMTEEKYYGSVTKNGKIESLGSAPINVKNINATVIFKNWSATKKVIVLDENGYASKGITGETVAEGYKITLDPNALYTVVTEEQVDIVDPYEQSEPNYVWWEGEDPYETNYPEHSHFDITTEGKWHLLSGGNWLTSDNENVDPETELYAKYIVNVPEDGEYNFWVRKFWLHGPFKWRFDDDEEWQICGKDASLADNVEFRTFICANWVNLGKVNLTQGEHVFEFRLLTGEGYNKVSGFDCFILTPDVFIPRGNLKPGEKSNLSEDGYWAFEPSADPFKEALLDLRSLNEEVAGQSGFVTRNGDRLLLGDGTPVKFWAVNATIYQDKKTIDYMARRLAKYGINLVRVHTALFDNDTSDLSINMEKLDKLHYFVHAMKQQGIYTNISFYFPLWIDIKPEFGIPGYDTIQNKKPFALLQFDEQFQQIYKNWANTIFTTQNPYTGVPLAQDPAVAMVEIQNEDSYLFWTFGRANIPEVQMKKLEKMYADWLIDKYGSLQNALEFWGEGSLQPKDNIEEGTMELKDAWFMTREGSGTGAFKKRMGDQLRFLVENQKKFYEDMVEFFKNDIGTSSLISCGNWTTADSIALDALERYTYTAGDIIDRHGYFECDHKGDGASYSVRAGHTYKDKSVLTNPGSCITQIVQIEGYPHMITETAWTNPNKYHGESVPMWSVFGALQGIDAIHFFAVGTADWEASIQKWPVMVPAVLGQFPAFALLYRRGDVAEAEEVLKVTESFEDLYAFKGSQVYEKQALDLLRDVNTPSQPEAPAVQGPDHALYNFENGQTHGFTNVLDKPGTATLQIDTMRKYAGESSLKVTYSGEKVAVGIQGAITDIPKGSKIKFRVYVPGDADIDMHFMIFGAGWKYNGHYKPAQWVEKDKWAEYELEFKEGDLPATALAIEIISKNAQSGSVWIDSITFDGYEPPQLEEPDQQEPEPTQTPQPTQTPEPSQTPKLEAVIEIRPNIDAALNKASAAIGFSQINNAILLLQQDNKQNNNIIDVKLDKSSIQDFVKTVEIVIPSQAINAIAQSEGIKLRIDTGNSTVLFDNKAITAIASKASSAQISISVKELVNIEIAQNIQQKTQDRPVYEFKVKSGTQEIGRFDTGKVEVEIPYTLKSGEKPSAIVVYYIDPEGKYKLVRSKYDASKEKIKFKTEHLSAFAVGYNPVSFIDVNDKAWYNEAVNFISAREITKGIGSGRFAPESHVTRADFLVMVMRAYGIEPDHSISDNFTDAGNKYYTAYLATAKKMGLVKGVGNDMFLPETKISRQDMMVILYRILEKVDELFDENNGRDFYNFNDALEVSDYARDIVKYFTKTGVVSGDGISLKPKEASTRAQAVQILYNLLSK